MDVVISIKSKADALVFAINKATENGKSFDRGKVDEIFDYILSKINLPDVEKDLTGYMDAIGGMVAKYSSLLDGMTLGSGNKE